MYVCMYVYIYIYGILSYYIYIYSSGETRCMLLDSFTKHPSRSSADHISKSVLCGRCGTVDYHPLLNLYDLKAFGEWKCDRGTTKLHARILRGKGVQKKKKKKPHMLTDCRKLNKCKFKFVFPVYVHIYIYIYVYIYICIYIYMYIIVIIFITVIIIMIIIVSSIIMINYYVLLHLHLYFVLPFCCCYCFLLYTIFIWTWCNLCLLCSFT